ncbi:MAG: HEAT repeat domain-containing protein [Thermoplasmatota archaeon]
MRVGNGFEELVLDLIIYLTAGAALFLFIQLLAYSTITVRNYRKRKNLIKKFPAWSDQLNAYLKKGRSRPRFYLRSEERKVFRDLLITYYTGVPQDPTNEELKLDHKLSESDRRRVRMLYRELGFIVDDITQIKDGTSWSKSTALGRLSRLELNDAEDLAVDLMESDNKDLVISCISYLASIKSRYLQEMISELIKLTDEKQFKELVMELTKADLQASHLKSLVNSPSIKERKAAAILLGRKDLKNSVQELKRLAIDVDEDVRFETVRSLGRIGSMRAGYILDSMMKDPLPEVKRAAYKEWKKIRNNNYVTSIWDLETDDKRTDDLLTTFNKDSAMESTDNSILGF